MTVDRVVLNVPQGIGDAFWVYQKFAPHVDRINFNIQQFEDRDEKVQNRAADFIRLLPKAGAVGKAFVKLAAYTRVASSFYPMRGVFERAARGYPSCDYACNLPIEQGVRIERIDPDYPIQQTVSLPEEPVAVPYSRYVVVFVAAASMLPGAEEIHLLWRLERWVELVTLIYRKRMISCPIVVVGASYDRPASELFSEGASAAGIENVILTDLPAKNVVYVLRRAVFFIGHQSGLNVLADNMGVRQLMLYSKTLHRMLYAWCAPGHAGRIFHAALFSQSPAEVADRLRCDL